MVEESDSAPADAEDRLLLDSMLGKLATYLRMCGYDAAYVLDEGEDPGDESLLERAREESRTLVTRDEQLARRAPESVFLRTKDIEAQLREFRDAGYDLTLSDEPVRCGSCNGDVVPVGDEEAVPTYAPGAEEAKRYRCRDCGQVFWRGSHWTDVAERLDELGE
ncbi:Mut7-C RNAse domain-containing protein [Halopelagius fulvigenes]|uniref:Mut7-C RNAse domain-containing protein n=1 Tax=Halopelagius fulvigenes TaxID=1198324 RepID=A0ABD5U4E7_9EURY